MRRQVDINWYVLEVDDFEVQFRKWARRPECRQLEFWRPLARVWKLMDGAWFPELEEMFPGYVLARCAAGPRRIEVVTGTRLLRAGRRRVPLTPAELMQIVEVMTREQYRVDHVLKIGQRVLFAEDARSPFAGLEAVYMGPLPVQNGYYARVAVVLSETVSTKVVPYDHLIPCDGRPERGSARTTRDEADRCGFFMAGRLTSIQRAAIQTKG